MDIIAFDLSLSNPNETTSDGAYAIRVLAGAIPRRVMKMWGSSRQLVNLVLWCQLAQKEQGGMTTG